jgi:OmpA-OmpF porin, OOP family
MFCRCLQSSRSRCWGFGSGGRSPKTVAFNAEEQIRLASQKALSALAASKPGYTAQDVVGALNFDIINFASGSAAIPADSCDFLHKAAVAIHAAPAGTVIEVGGYTDNTGEAASNLQLSQQRADAVRDYLVKQGVDPAALVAKGYGDLKPIASNAKR